MFWSIKDALGYFKETSTYPVCTVNWIVMACCLIHNLIRREMAVDPIEEYYDISRPRRQRRDEEYIDTIKIFLWMKSESWSIS